MARYLGFLLLFLPLEVSVSLNHVCLSYFPGSRPSPRDNENNGLSFLPSLITADWFPRGVLYWPHSSDEELKSMMCLCLFQALISESHVPSHPLCLLNVVCWILCGAVLASLVLPFLPLRTFLPMALISPLVLPVPFVLPLPPSVWIQDNCSLTSWTHFII